MGPAPTQASRSGRCKHITGIYRNELGMNEERLEGFKTHTAGITPLGRTGTPDEIAKSVSFLASDDASYITSIFVDGGQAQN
jgi:NAD(P)-dependent dehydrogenase (short-subunit alcohol dehydrogenase family)